MTWIRGHRLDTAAIVAMVAGVVLLASVLLPMLSSGGDAAASEAVDEPPVLEGYSSFEDQPTPDATDDDQAAGADDAAPGSTTDQVSDGLQAFGRSSDLPGLAGSGATAGLPRHELTITFTSTAPMGTIGYQIPTSAKDFYGIVEDVGRSWSLSTAVYGPPDYAQGFAQAGLRGTPVTCTITVDGRVTERRTTDGPYGQLFCQG